MPRFPHLECFLMLTYTAAAFIFAILLFLPTAHTTDLFFLSVLLCRYSTMTTLPVGLPILTLILLWIHWSLAIPVDNSILHSSEDVVREPVIAAKTTVICPTLLTSAQLLMSYYTSTSLLATISAFDNTLLPDSTSAYSIEIQPAASSSVQKNFVFGGMSLDPSVSHISQISLSWTGLLYIFNCKHMGPGCWWLSYKNFSSMGTFHEKPPWEVHRVTILQLYDKH